MCFAGLGDSGEWWWVLPKRAGRRARWPGQRSDCLNGRPESRLGTDRGTREPGKGDAKDFGVQLDGAVSHSAGWLESMRRSALLPDLLRANDGLRGAFP